MTTLGKIPSFFAKGDNVCHFLFALLYNKCLLKRGLLYKKRMCSLFIFRTGQNTFDRAVASENASISIKYQLTWQIELTNVYPYPKP